MAGEFALIDWIKQQPLAGDILRVAIPIGDDLAALRWQHGDDLLLVGVDQVLDGRHFDRRVHKPAAIGRKAMNRNLSDCAAMACLPAAAVVSVALPDDAALTFAKSLFRGLSDAAALFDCPIVGGDTATWAGPLAVTITILGRSAGLSPVTRSGARPGDGLFVTGPLGGSILGRHMTFTPRVALARAIAAGGRVSAMIDLSDGLSRDVRHLCSSSRVGVTIDAGAIPLHRDAIKFDDFAPAEMRGRTPLEHALHDGEDYELLFTVPAARAGEIRKTRIGTIDAEPGVRLRFPNGVVTPLDPLGWEHQLR